MILVLSLVQNNFQIPFLGHGESYQNHVALFCKVKQNACTTGEGRSFYGSEWLFCYSIRVSH